MPASLRSGGVRLHPGMPFGFIPDLAFGFAGIPTIDPCIGPHFAFAVQDGGDPPLALQILITYTGVVTVSRALSLVVEPAARR